MLPFDIKKEPELIVQALCYALSNPYLVTECTECSEEYCKVGCVDYTIFVQICGAVARQVEDTATVVDSCFGIEVVSAFIGTTQAAIVLTEVTVRNVRRRVEVTCYWFGTTYEASN